MIKNKRFKELNPNYREEYYKTHKKQELGKNAKWYINNKLHHQALVAKYRILKREQSINLTQQELVDIQSYYILSSYLSSFGTPYEVDHIMPIAKGGATHSSNLQVITQRDNRSKGARLEYTYKDEVFKL
jgi:5-methylcytosine-specific restriction endonuclease McrA